MITGSPNGEHGAHASARSGQRLMALRRNQIHTKAANIMPSKAIVELVDRPVKIQK